VAGRLGYSTAWRPQRGPRAARTYAEELPLYWRVPVAAWTFVIALPLIAAWAIVNGDWDPVGAIFLGLLWLLYFGLLRWHSAAKGRARERNRLRQVE
jgi:fatty acid desaturase